MQTAEDDATVCPSCGQQMQPEHAHYRCRFCGYRDTCCDGAPATGETNSPST